MEKMGQRRDKQIEQQGEVLAEIGAGIREQSAGIRAILERTQPNPSSQGG